MSEVTKAQVNDLYSFFDAILTAKGQFHYNAEYHSDMLDQIMVKILPMVEHSDDPYQCTGCEMTVTDISYDGLCLICQLGAYHDDMNGSFIGNEIIPERSLFEEDYTQWDHGEGEFDEDDRMEEMFEDEYND